MAKTTEKLAKHGLFFGKFYPFHQGHAKVISSMLYHTDHSKVVVMGMSSEDIPLTQRVNWIKKEFPNVEVEAYCVNTNDPSNPLEQITLNNTFWNNFLFKLMDSKPEEYCLFGGEDYIKPWAKSLGSKCNIVDKDTGRAYSGSHTNWLSYDEEIHIVSGSSIRQDLHNRFFYLTNPAKVDLAKRVSIIGHESSGKTTLAQEFSKVKVGYRNKFGYVPEYGRTYFETLGTPVEKWTITDLILLAQKHRELEDKASTNNESGIIVSDTDLLQTMAWSQMLFGFIPKELESIGIKTDFYVLLSSNEFYQDGTRIFSEKKDRVEFNRILLGLVNKYNIPYIIPGTDKYQTVLQAIQTRYNLR